MRFCKVCGTPYTKALGVCPKCNAAAVQEEQQEANAAPPLNEQDQKAARKHSWILIAIFVPGLIGFLYGLYAIMRALTPH